MDTFRFLARCLLFAGLLPFVLLAQNPVRITDINPGAGSAFFAANNYWVHRDILDDVLYIQAYDPISGTELWKSVPSYTGAALVKDLNPGTEKGSWGNYLPAFGKLFFSGFAGDKSALCWSNGTTQGTAVLTTGKDGFFQGSAVSQGKIFSSQNLVEYGGTIRFKSTRFAGYLHATDPATGATTLLKTVDDGIGWMADVNGTLLLLAMKVNYPNPATHSIWKSNGTGKGTVKIVDLPVLENISVQASTDLYRELATFAVVDAAAIYFTWGNPATGGRELWRTDGTPAGTVAVTDINPGSGNSFPTMVARMGEYLYFSANDGSNGFQIWRLPLAGGPAERVTDIDGGTLGADPMWLTPLNGKLFFSAYTPEYGRELWVSNGLPYNNPAAVTVMLDAANGGIAAGGASSNPNYFTSPQPTNPPFVDDDPEHRYGMEALGSYVYFPADDGTGFALWRSDGMTTEKLGASKPRYLTAINNMLLFIAYDDTYGNELWKFDPSLAPSPKHPAALPVGLELAQNYPNPFSSTTTFEYAVPAEGRVLLRVLDLLGREVAVLADGLHGAGRHAVEWNAAALPSGMYLCRLESDGQTVTRMVNLVR
ncbi:MAG: T9SS type A sorting domain-containing protein [Bacteroidota bacterium]|nr:T9SS type A sorting domain-containing protein [Bacteroidota bacterium]